MDTLPQAQPRTADARPRSGWRRYLNPSLKRLLLSILLCWFLFGVAEVAFVSVHESVHPFRYKLFLLDQLMRGLFWAGIGWTLAVLPRPPRIVAILALGLTLSYMTVASWLLAAELGEFFSVATILPVLESPALLTGYSQSYLRGWNFVFWILGALVFVLIWSPIARAPRRGGWKAPATALLLLALVLVPLNQLTFRSAKGGAILSIEGSMFVALKHARGQMGNPNYDLPSRLHIAPYESDESNERLNILFVLVESWAKAPLKLGTPETTMPFLSEWMDNEPDRFLSFERALTNSADTKVSVPSVMSGVSPERPRSELYHAPLLWHWGVASGRQAFFVTSQIYKWVSFYNFFITGFPGQALTADTIDAPIVNDLGIDDLVSVGEFQRLLRQRDRNRPFVAVYNPNALHYPGQQTSKLLDQPLPEGLPRYHSALLIVDEALRRIHSTLVEEGVVDDTVIIMAADHGEHVAEKGELPRLISYDPPVANTPLLVRVPASWAEKHPKQHRALLLNRDRNVANVDVVPTVADFLGARANRANAMILDNLSGASLLSPVPEDRTLISLTPLVDGKGTAAFSVARGDLRVVLSNTTSAPKLFNTDTDPANEIDLWEADAAATERERLIETIRSEPRLEPIYRKF